ncbi:MAG TPA: SDR family NAD(P)-dependent oxidoreductase [Chloroflexota bacterium]|jgi:NAD(P)-dependent dehydrogenase (short-subunit alcohol dehydrogenase family)
MQLSGKVAVITGGASGIGRATALALARRGADVVLADVHEGRLAEARAAVEALGRRALPVRCDVTRDADVERLAREALAAMDHVDVLMNNAGVVLCGALEEIPIADWQWEFDINFFGVVRGIRAFLPHMLARGSGYVVNTASMAGLLALTGPGAPYVASKYAVVGLSEALALYVRPRGIGVSVLCPAAVATNLAENGRVIGLTPEVLAADTRASKALLSAEEMAPEAIGELVAAGIEQEQFLIYSDPAHADLLVQRAQDVDGMLRLLQAAASEGAGPQ